MKKFLMILLMAGIALPSLALQPMFDDAGFNGLVNFGASGGEIETNFLAQIDGLNIDLGAEKIDALGSPDSESVTMPVANFDLGYTLSNQKTRFSIGSDMDNLLAFDAATRLSVRHNFDSLGDMKLSALAPSSMATKVYADPYQTGVKRKTTDQEFTGVRFTWDKIMGSNFEAILNAKSVDVDDEFSGQALGLSKADRDLLDRNGDIMGLELGYKFTLNDHHSLRPGVKYLDRDLDGDAMSQDGVVVSLAHMYRSDSMVWASRVSYADMSGDKKNPIFGDTNDADVYGFASVMSFPGSIGFLGKWTPNVSVAWGDSDNDVDFNDSNIWMVSAALSRRF